MKKEQRGFTLLELNVAVVLVGFLISIALPTFNGAVEKAPIAQASRDDIVRAGNGGYLGLGED